jgi:acetyl-CoA/propionyl-CoA carboxylase carboxyl transferase subunit
MNTPTSTPHRTGPRALDPREPEVRLAALLDEGTLVGLHATDTSGVWAVRGRIDGSKVIAFCTEAPGWAAPWAMRGAGTSSTRST